MDTDTDTRNDWWIMATINSFRINSSHRISHHYYSVNHEKPGQQIIIDCRECSRVHHIYYCLLHEFVCNFLLVLMYCMRVAIRIRNTRMGIDGNVSAKTDQVWSCNTLYALSEWYGTVNNVRHSGPVFVHNLWSKMFCCFSSVGLHHRCQTLII